MSASSIYLYPFEAMNSFLDVKLSPNSVKHFKSCFGISALLYKPRVLGFIVVCHIISGSFSPKPFERITDISRKFLIGSRISLSRYKQRRYLVFCGDFKKRGLGNKYFACSIKEGTSLKACLK
jgi:hypothetical protein